MSKQVILMKRNMNNEKILDIEFNKEDINVFFTNNTDEVIKTLDQKDGEVSLIIIDMEEDPLMGLDCITSIKGKYKYKHIPVVIISKKEDVMNGLAIGAQEYIIPPYTLNELCEFTKNIISSKEPVNELYCPQTSIDMSFEQYFNSEIKRAERGGYDLSILVLTISPKDTSQVLNDRNMIEIINHVALVVKQNLRTTDTILRYNNKNLIAFLPFTTSFNAEIVYEKILSVSHEKLIKANSQLTDYEVIYSIVSYPKDGENVEDLLFNAENRLK